MTVLAQEVVAEIIEAGGQEKIRDWFGDRGIELKKTRIIFKIIEKNNQKWLFIKDNCFEDVESCNRVEMYFMDTIYCEVYDSWYAKGFSWDANKLRDLIPDLAEEEEEESEYFIDLNTTTNNATNELFDLDKKFVGTPDYLGLAFFWGYEFKYWLRDCTVAERKKVHSEWLKQGLDFAADSDNGIDCAPHWKIIKQVCKTVAEQEEKGKENGVL
tara:strand:+ start:182 stop:823 length:642 start_codon:yes stop_codon:yes gene_type:complete